MNNQHTNAKNKAEDKKKELEAKKASRPTLEKKVEAMTKYFESKK